MIYQSLCFNLIHQLNPGSDNYQHVNAVDKPAPTTHKLSESEFPECTDYQNEDRSLLLSHPFLFMPALILSIQ